MKQYRMVTQLSNKKQFGGMFCKQDNKRKGQLKWQFRSSVYSAITHDDEMVAYKTLQRMLAQHKLNTKTTFSSLNRNQAGALQ